jgi:thiol-disulfide isomerase/thioredoxin
MFNIQFSKKGKGLLVMMPLFCAAVSAQEIKAVKVTDLEKIIRESKRPLVVNFWATWCKPCLEEIPYFQQEAIAHRKDSLELIFVSVDYKEEFPKGIAAMAAKRNISSTVVWLNESNADYFCPRIDKNWSGAVPSTLFINNKTGYRRFREEQVPEDELKKLVSETIAQ